MKHVAFTRLHAIRDAHGLRVAEKAVLYALALYIGSNEVWAPSQSTLALGAGLTRPRCNEVIAALEGKGIVRVRGRCLGKTRARTSSEYSIDYRALAAWDARHRPQVTKRDALRNAVTGCAAKEQPLSEIGTRVVPQENRGVVPERNTKRSVSEEITKKITEESTTAPSARAPSALSLEEEEKKLQSYETRARTFRAFAEDTTQSPEQRLAYKAHVEKLERSIEEIRKALAQRASKEAAATTPAPASDVRVTSNVRKPAATNAVGCSAKEQPPRAAGGAR